MLAKTAVVQQTPAIGKDDAKTAGGQWTPETHCPRILFNAKDCWRAANPLWCRLGLNGEKKIDEYEKWACNNCLECENTDVASSASAALLQQDTPPEPPAPEASAAKGTVESLTTLSDQQKIESTSQMEHAKTADSNEKAALDAAEFNRRKMEASNTAAQLHQQASDLHRVASQKAADAKAQREKAIAAHAAMLADKEAFAAAMAQEKEAQSTANTACRGQQQKQVLSLAKSESVKRIKAEQGRAQDGVDDKLAELNSAEKALELAKRDKDRSDEELAKATNEATTAQEDYDKRSTELDAARQAASDSMDKMTQLGADLGKAKAESAFDDKLQATADETRIISRTEFNTGRVTAQSAAEEATRAEHEATAAVKTAENLALKAQAIQDKLSTSEAAGAPAPAPA